MRGRLGSGFYAAAPITTSGRHRLGTVKVMEYQPRQVTDAQITVLALLADIVACHLDLRLTAIHTYTHRDQLGPPVCRPARGAVGSNGRLTCGCSGPRQYLTCGRVQP